ncbi:unnamed protein product [Cuscuta campestris]|uniref:SWI/SNF-like complex subunit BAF250 C-terminal domain-containing protein n=2 Tax=Cuscuta sect. Cleistogrammica TaxID=1824901 RepID=A0A484LDW3_9ASTE|nr:hypothetical protein DM860_009503 [Cuscuta australis]VFQ74504.1 unnamed protein product [Cuscuta campestris]
MQKREQGKQSSGSGGTAPTPAKRGRPVGSGSNQTAAAAASAAVAAIAAASTTDFSAPSTLVPSVHVHSALAELNYKRIVLALQSGLKSELTWAFNTLTLLSFKEKDEIRRDAIPLSKIPGLLDALLQIIDEWRDIALPRVLVKAPRVRLLGTNSFFTGFGNEYDEVGSNGSIPHPSSGTGSSIKETSVQKTAARTCHAGWWFEEDGLFSLDEEGRTEKQQCAVVASNIIRNFSFIADNEAIMANHRHCVETLFQCLEDYVVEDEELVTNVLETIVNLCHSLDLRIFSSSKPSVLNMREKRAVEAIMGLLRSSVRAWHCGAAELIGRLILNPDNEPFILPFALQIYKRLIDMMSLPTNDAQAAAVGALYNLVEVNMDCRLKLASERWAIDRLLKVIKSPHPVSEVCRKAASILESLVAEPQNKPLLLAFETAFTEILFADGKHSDIFARILCELTSRPGKSTLARGIWGM